METKRKSLFEERYDEIKRRHISFIKMIQEKAAKMYDSWVPFLPNDLMFMVFLLLPVRSLLRFTSVCKAWYKLIHCAEFVQAYNAHAEVTPIVLRTVLDRETPSKIMFHVETQLKYFESFSFFPCSQQDMRSKVIHFLEIVNDKGKLIDLNIGCSGSVVAMCNGLILISSLNKGLGYRRHTHLDGLDPPLVYSGENIGRLIVMNPMTRKLIGVPAGTLPSRFLNESYGLAFSHSKGVYKVVHLFKDRLDFMGCEIFSLQTRSWKAVDGPSGMLFSNFSQAPIATRGALHWLPSSPFNHYIITMGADDENFSVTDLPTTMSNYDRLIEMGGFLSLVNNLDKDHIDVWVLKGLNGTEWVKQHTIHVNGLNVNASSVDDDDDDDNAVIPHNGFVNKEYSIPCFALNAKEMVFRRRDRFYSYDFELEDIKEIKMVRGRINANETIMPHYNNLATWEALEPMS